MANENCLAGYACPICKYDDSLLITATSVFRVDDDGVEDYEDVFWDDTSTCHCPECRHTATLGDFRTYRYDHLMDVGFSVKTNLREPDTLDIIAALEARLNYLKLNLHEVKEACGLVDTTDNMPEEGE